MLGERLFTPMILVFDETEQDFSVDRHQKKFAATKRREEQSAGMSFHGTSEMNQEYLARQVGAGKKRYTKKPGSPSKGWQNPYSTTRGQFTGHSKV